MKLLSFLTEGIAGLQMAASPIIIGAFFAGLIYSTCHNKMG